MDYSIIELSKGKSAKVDASDYDLLVAHKWYCSAYGYAVRSFRRDAKLSIVYMHRIILNAPDGLEVDHIDGDRLNNSRSNLRLVTKAQNLRNSKPRTGGSSRFKGVNWNKATNKWRARINFEHKAIPLGCFTTEIEAAEAYNRAAIRLFGEFAKLNEIISGGTENHAN